MNPDHQDAFDAFMTYIRTVYKRLENGEIPDQSEINAQAQKTLNIYKSINQDEVQDVKTYMAKMIEEMDTLASTIATRIETLKQQS